jgi:hypothetical protein
VLAQIIDGPGHPAPRQVAGRGDGYHRKISQFASRQFSIRKLADAHGDIKTFADQIDTPVGDAKFELHVRMPREEGLCPCPDQRPSDKNRRGDAQQAAGVIGHLHDILGILDRAQQRCDAFVIGRAFGGEAERPCRSLQQAHAETALQARDAL